MFYSVNLQINICLFLKILINLPKYFDVTVKRKHREVFETSRAQMAHANTCSKDTRSHAFWDYMTSKCLLRTFSAEMSDPGLKVSIYV